MLDEQVQEFIADVRAGLSDDTLKRKYSLSGQKFLIAKASAKDYLAKVKRESAKPTRTIDGKQFLTDLESGLDDDALMMRYNLTQRQLQRLFRQLISAGLVTALQISKRLSITKSQVTEAFVEMGKAIKELD
jgi:hypothetical protein